MKGQGSLPVGVVHCCEKRASRRPFPFSQFSRISRLKALCVGNHRIAEAADAVDGDFDGVAGTQEAGRDSSRPERNYLPENVTKSPKLFVPDPAGCSGNQDVRLVKSSVFCVLPALSFSISQRVEFGLDLCSPETPAGIQCHCRGMDFRPIKLQDCGFRNPDPSPLEWRQSQRLLQVGAIPDPGGEVNTFRPD